jgi:hypothetical protein
MRRWAFIGSVVAGCAVLASSASAKPATTRSLDGSGNNVRHPAWGKADTVYPRVGKAGYADGVARMADGPPARYVSNRIFNDVGQNLFSENDVTQWGWVWGQFLDHDFDLRDERRGEPAAIAYDRGDPLEAFTNDLGAMSFWRTPAASGTGRTTPRQQVNVLSSYIDASSVYGTTRSRLSWLRDGPRLMLTYNGYLPRVGARGAARKAPVTELFGALVGQPSKAVVAGDVRANENIALTAVQTLLAREHNRIVTRLPAKLPAEQRFQIARRVVGAEIQYITYTQFLPALGVKLRAYRGYDPKVNPAISNEFAAAGYRAHSMVHGEFDLTEPAGYWSDARLAGFRSAGIRVEGGGSSTDPDGPPPGAIRLEVPLTVGFGNPDLVESVGLGPILRGLAAERQYRNDEQIDDALRSVLFQVPKPGATDPAACGVPVVSAACYTGIEDLGAIDIERARDHGVPSYNALRQAYGLPAKTSFWAITGEGDQADAVPFSNDLSGLAFVGLRDHDGNPIPLGSLAAQEQAVSGVRRTSLASRLAAVYGDVARLDGFVGMLSEPHVPGTELGALQLAMWKRQFEALRDGDRFFYANDPALKEIQRRYGITYRRTLAQLIVANTGARVQANAFKLAR